MKKSKKLISLLLALVMLLGIIPMAVAADGTIVYDGVTLYTNTKPRYFTFLRNNAEGNVTKDVGESGVYQRLPRYTNICSCGRTLVECIPDEYSANAQKTVELSDPTVLKDLSFTISGWSDDDFYSGDPCLTFNYTAAKPGTTNVKLTFYYNYNFDGASGKCKRCGRYANIPAMNTWLQETTTFTVTVTGDSGEDEKPDVTVTYTDGVENEEVFANQVYPVKKGDPTPAFEGTPTRTGYKFLGWNPEVAETVTVNATYTAKWEKVESVDKPTRRPSLSDRCYVRVQCVNTDAGHTYQYLDLLPSGGTGRYTVDTDEDGNVFIEKDGVWTYTITLNRAKFIESFCASTHVNKAPHTDLNPDQVTKMSWTWNAKQKKWKLDPVSKNLSTVGALIKVECDLHSVAEHTVTYTDGVDGAAFADQTYTVKEGDATPEFVGEPTRKGYKFLGWEPTVATTVTGNAVYTATWELETYTITYDLRKVVKSSDVRNMNNPTAFTVEELPITLNTPNFKNNEWPQKFLNWRDADGNVLTQITEPGDITLYAYYQFPVRYRVYDEDGKEVKDLTVVEWYNEDEFASYEVRPATVDMPGYELDGWYQTTKDFGKENKRFGSLYMAKKYELVGKLSCCINVTVEHNGEIVKTEKFKGLKGESPDYKSMYKDILSQILENGTLLGFTTYVDDQTADTPPVFGTNAEVKIVIKSN